MSYFGLVANYGSSSENESEEEKESKELTGSNIKEETSVNYFTALKQQVPEPKKKVKKKKKELLANPLRNAKSSKTYVDDTTSVFYNPFQKDQEDKNAVLEQHVKLTVNPKDMVEINGKKICWNYRKGRCKFGHKCKFAHDSDLIGKITHDEMSTSENPTSELYNMQSLTNSFQIESESMDKRKRKPGLSEGLIPNQKSRKIYKDIQTKEAPWKQKN